MYVPFFACENEFGIILIHFNICLKLLGAYYQYFSTGSDDLLLILIKTIFLFFKVMFLIKKWCSLCA